LLCKSGFWNDWAGSTNPLKQRCVSNICKESEDTDRSQCSSCWQTIDVENYETFPGRGSFPKTAFAGMYKYAPFVLKEKVITITTVDPDTKKKKQKVKKP